MYINLSKSCKKVWQDPYVMSTNIPRSRYMWYYTYRILEPYGVSWKQKLKLQPSLTGVLVVWSKYSRCFVSFQNNLLKFHVRLPTNQL